MGLRVKLENETGKDLLVQVELTGLEATVPPASKVIVDTDLENQEGIHIELRNDRVIVWGGVAASLVQNTQ